MRICLLTDQDLSADPFPAGDWPCDPRPYLPDDEWEVVTLKKESAVAQVVAAHRRGFDLFFNLCDGAWDEGRVGIEVVQALEWLDVPFTGADRAFFEPSREAMKRVCHAWDIDTPAYRLVRSVDQIDEAAAHLRFPMFVKHFSSYASSGLTRASRVTTPEELHRQARAMVDAVGAALVEEFVEGVECTVLVSENAHDPAAPHTYRPLQYRFPEGESFKHYQLKWVNYGGLESFPVEDPELDARLRDVSARFFQGMRGAGYGRCDIRVDAEGRAQMLEINPLCGVFYPASDPGSADLCLAHDPAGHTGFARHVVEAALARHRRRRRGWAVQPHPSGGYGIYATRAAEPGDRLVAFEEQAHHLVTRSHVEARWDARRRDWFERYAWPLTDEVWVMWSDDPDEWRPVNHACDPTAWLEGLDVVARVPLRPGDEITLDYATFYDERMPAFDCACGAPSCRGVIRGTDHLQDFVAGYGRHVSDHVARRRADAANGLHRSGPGA